MKWNEVDTSSSSSSYVHGFKSIDPKGDMLAA